MVNFVRLIFVVFLVSLQLVAPLIHAHKNEQFNVASSFHLPEFEQVNTLSEHNLAMISPSYNEGEVVTVSFGIKGNQKQDMNDFVILSFLFIVAFSLSTIKRFFIQTELIKFFYSFNLSAPRAPPFFLNF